MKKYGLIIGSVSILALILLYYLFIRNLIASVYTNQAPFWFQYIIQTIYPRLDVEKHRFGVSFFLQKADQVVLRLCLIQMLCWSGAYLINYPSKIKETLIYFWQKKIPLNQVNHLRILFYSGMIFFTHEWYNSLTALSRAAIFYKPLLLLQLFSIQFPSRPLLLILYIILLSSCLAVILNIKPLYTSTSATLLFVGMQGLLYSFEKLDHTFATFTYAAMLMPFLLLEQKKAMAKHLIIQEAWPLQLICLCISLVYFLSGLEKLLISGLDWMHADNFRSYIFLHQAPVGLAVAKSNFLCVLLPVLAIIFQLCFFAINFYRKLRVLILITGLCFHAGTYLLLNIGWYISPWIFVYIFFIDWYKINPKSLFDKHLKIFRI